MTSFMDNTPGHIVIGGVVSFAFGCALGAINKSPILESGAVCGASGIAVTIFESVVEHFAIKNDWILSDYYFVKGIGNALLHAAFLIAAFALGVLGPIGIAVLGILGGVYVLYDIGRAVHLKINGNEVTVVEAAKQKLEEEKRERQKQEQEARVRAQQELDMNRFMLGLANQLANENQ